MKQGDREDRFRGDPEIPGEIGTRENVENVILSVARAERLVNGIGKSLLDPGHHAEDESCAEAGEFLWDDDDG